MKIGLLKSALQKMMPAKSPVIAEIKTFVHSLKGDDERELSCQEELLLGNILYRFSEKHVAERDWEFVKKLKVDLFADMTKAAFFGLRLGWAENVYVNLKTLPLTLLQPVYVDVIKHSVDPRSTVSMLLALGYLNALNAETAACVDATRHDRKEFADLLPRLTGILNKDILTALNQSEKNLSALIEAYLTLHSAGILNANTIKLVNTCDAELGTMVGALFDLHKAGQLKPAMSEADVLNKLRLREQENEATSLRGALFATKQPRL